MPWLYSFIGVMAVGLILQLAFGLDFAATISFIGLVGIVFFAFLLSVIKKVKKRFEALTCNKCKTLIDLKTPEDFDKYISYVVEKDEAIYKGEGIKCTPTDGVYSYVKISATSSAVLSVELTCPCCGEVKQLKYYAEPFKCHTEQKNISTVEYSTVYSLLTGAVHTAVNDYNCKETKEKIPYTYHSSKNPNFEQRFTFKGVNGAGAHPTYKGVRIDYRKDVEEMLEHFVILKELNGTLCDPKQAKK